MCRVQQWSADVAGGEVYSDRLVRHWTLSFLHNGQFMHVAYKKRSSTSVIHDPGARQQMTTWLNTASRAHPPAKAKDFMAFVNTAFTCNIKERTALIWLHLLGFHYKRSSSLEMYMDGHQRPDVLAALGAHVVEMQDLLEQQITYTGNNMQGEVVGARLEAHGEIIVSFHDECCSHASEHESRRWMKSGSGGRMQDKSRGACRMVAAYVCAKKGLWKTSMQFINPGKNKDGWWDGEATQKQAGIHLLEFDLECPGCRCADVYDNSSGHNCRATDALDVEKMNKGVGGKNEMTMRDTTYRCAEGEDLRQSMFFEVGDVLRVPVKMGLDCEDGLGLDQTVIQLK
jgi:hypothetical protein